MTHLKSILCLAAAAAVVGTLTPDSALAQADPAIAYVAKFTSRGKWYWDVTVMNADGSNRGVIWSRTSYIYAVAWSPDLDGNQGNGYQGTLAITGNSAAHTALWLLDVVVAGGTPRGSNLRVLIDGNVDPVAATQLDPEWSPDLDALTPGYQGKIAFEGHNLSLDTYGINVIPMFWDGATVQPVNGPNSSEALYLPPPGVGTGSPTWSPDGSRITLKQGGLGAVVIDAATGTVQNVITGTTQSFGHQWSRTPGSSVVALIEADHLHTMDVDIGISSLTPLPGAPCFDRNPTWSPDDRYIVFSGIDCGTKKKFTIRRTDTLTGQVTTLAAEAGKDLVLPDWRRF